MQRQQSRVAGTSQLVQVTAASAQGLTHLQDITETSLIIVKISMSAATTETCLSSTEISMLDQTQMADTSIMQGLHNPLGGIMLLTQVFLTLSAVGRYHTELTIPKR